MPEASLFFLAAGLSLAAGRCLIHRARAWGFLDQPGERKIHQAPVPRTGGLAMALGGGAALAAALLVGWLPWPSVPWQTLAAGAGFTVLGGLDDRFHFRARRKLPWLLACSVLAAWPWVARTQAPGFPDIMVGGAPIHLPAFALALLLAFWFMALTTAVNVEDAINGYMGGFMLLLLLGCALSGIRCWIPAGAAAGFLALNWPRAKHFMGDAGSLGGGFILAEVLLRGGGLNDPLRALVWTAPISLDVAVVLVRRHREGISLLGPDQFTCPHHLLALCRGSQVKAAPLLWANTLICLLLYRNLAWAAAYLAAYAAGLLYLNRQVFSRKGQGLQDPGG